jgi:hypothetical protein
MLVHVCTRHISEEQSELVRECVLRVVVVGVVIDIIALADNLRTRRELDLADGGNEGDDVYAVYRLQIFFCDSTSGYTACQISPWGRGGKKGTSVTTIDHG